MKQLSKHMFMNFSFFALLNCIMLHAQHWPTMQFQSDSIYKSSGVKHVSWKGDSTKSSLLVEAEFDRNGRIIELDPLTDPTTYYAYDESGKLTGEWDWDGHAEFTYDEKGRVLTKTFYSDKRVVVKEVNIRYDPVIITSKRYEDGELFQQKRYVFETATSVKEYSIETMGSIGELTFSYQNTYNEKGQIIKTRHTTSTGDFLGEATYAYHANGLLNTISVASAFTPPVVHKLVYTYY